MLSAILNWTTDPSNSTGVLLVLLLVFIYVCGELMDAVRRTGDEDELD